MQSELQSLRCAFVTQEKIKTKDGAILYKSYFLTEDKKLLIYWLQIPITLEVDLPQCELNLEQRVSNEGKLELKVKDVKFD